MPLELQNGINKVEVVNLSINLAPDNQELSITLAYGRDIEGTFSPVFTRSEVITGADFQIFLSTFESQREGLLLFLQQIGKL